MDKKPFPFQNVFLDSISLNRYGYNKNKKNNHNKNFSYTNNSLPFLSKSPEKEEHDRKTLFDSFNVNKFLNRNINQQLKTPILPEKTQKELIKNSFLNTFGDFIIMTKEKEYKKGIPILTLKQEEFENKISYRPKKYNIPKNINFNDRKKNINEIITNKEILSHFSTNYRFKSLNKSIPNDKFLSTRERSNNSDKIINKNKVKIQKRNLDIPHKLFINRTEIEPIIPNNNNNNLYSLFEMKEYYDSFRTKPFKFK